MGRRASLILTALVLAAALLAFPALAFAYPEEGSAEATTTCTGCHPDGSYSASGGTGTGPHGGYSAISVKCSLCHQVHTAAGGGTTLLLPALTVTDSCKLCHDGTGGYGVYGAIAARGLTVGGGHRIDTATVVPGGDAATGGDATYTFSSTGGTLGCGDCHTPHGASTVASYTAERWRTRDASGAPPLSTKLLKNRPNGNPYDIPVYGSDWCASCHRGRLSGGAVHNHPVESTATAGYFYYSRVARLESTSSANTVIGNIGNLAMLMPYPRSAEQTGHAPICQQCHEDSRHVGTVGDAIADVVYVPDGVDGLEETSTAQVSNPRFQNFPHESENATMLVEPADDLCTNCHPPTALP